MKRVGVLIMLLMVISCGENKTKSNVIAVDTSSATSKEKQVYEAAERKATFKDSAVGLVYDNYNAVKTALVNTDPMGTKLAAEDLSAALNSLEANNALKKSVEKLSAEEDIEVQREIFQEVTAGVKSLVQNNLEEGKLYYQYCPMAFQGKGGYWLSNEEKIRNPYWGDKMLTCGVVQGEIK